MLPLYFINHYNILIILIHVRFICNCINDMIFVSLCLIYNEYVSLTFEVG